MVVRNSATPHETCAVFNDTEVEPNGAIHRFIVGLDAAPHVLTPTE
jgi:hypothetical protein